MKRWMALLLLVIVVAASYTAVIATPKYEQKELQKSEQRVAEQQLDYDSFGSAVNTAACEIQTAVKTYVRALVIVVKAVVAAAKAVVLALLSLMVRFVTTLVIAVGYWLLALFFG